MIAGLGHLEHRFGVPERVDSHNVIAREQTCIISVRDTQDLAKDIEDSQVGRVDKFKEAFPGDYIYLYDSDDSNVKDEISAAYDKVDANSDLSVAMLFVLIGWCQCQCCW